MEYETIARLTDGTVSTEMHASLRAAKARALTAMNSGTAVTVEIWLFRLDGERVHVATLPDDNI